MPRAFVNPQLLKPILHFFQAAALAIINLAIEVGPVHDAGHDRTRLSHSAKVAPRAAGPTQQFLVSLRKCCGRIHNQELAALLLQLRDCWFRRVAAQNRSESCGRGQPTTPAKPRNRSDAFLLSRADAWAWILG